jgi:hypothetical protein
MWVSCRLRTDSHTLTSSAFRLFQLDASNIRIHDVREHDLLISVRPLNTDVPETAQLHECHRVITAMLIALNVGALGTFAFAQDPWAHPVLTAADDLAGANARSSALVVEADTAYPERRQIEEVDVENSALVFGIIARERTPVLTGEYCRGLLLARMNVLELNFRRESFLCFYRALEHFVANRLLKVRRLSNELRDLQRGLRMLTDDQELNDELRTVYRIRSSQVAHSQGTQSEISQDDLIKTKVFLDLVMHKTFKEEANRAMAARRDAKAKGGAGDA